MNDFLSFGYKVKKLDDFFKDSDDEDIIRKFNIQFHPVN